MGGTTGATSFNTLDIDASGNLILGGQTSDTGVAQIYNAPDPILAYLSKSAFQWGISFYGANFFTVASVKFNPAGTKATALMQDNSLLLPLQIAVVQASDGALLKTIKEATSLPNLQFKTGGGLLVDSTDQVYVGYAFTNNTWTRFALLKLDPHGATPNVSKFYIAGNERDPVRDIGPWSIVLNTAQNHIIIGGAILYDDNDFYSCALSQISVAGTIKWEYGFQNSVEGSLNWVIGFINLVNVASVEYVWGCGELGTDFMVMKVTVQATSSAPLTSGTTFGQYNGASGLVCRGIGLSTDTTTYVLGSLSTNTEVFKLMKADFSGATKTLSFFDFNAAFAGSTSNVMYSGIFSGSNVYFVGSVLKIDGNLMQTFSKPLGFVMSTDPTILSHSSQIQNCLTQTISYTGTVNLVTTAQNFMSYLRIGSKPSKTFTVDTVLKVRNLLSLTLINQAAWCSSSTTVTFGASPFSNVIYNMGTTDSTTSPAVAIPVTNPTTCTDIVFTNTAVQQGTTALPSFLTYNSATNAFSWPAVTTANQGIYTIEVKSVINNGQNVVFSFTFEVRSCLVAVITKGTQANIKYLVTALGTMLTINFSPFTSSMSAAQCGAMNYDTTFSSTALLSSPPYSYTANSLSLSIATTDTSLAAALPHNLLFSGWQGTYTSLKQSIAFTVTFTTDCTTAVITPPSGASYDYTLNQAAINHVAGTFTTDLSGCETQFVFTCPDCSDPSLETFDYVTGNLQVSSSFPDHVGLHTYKIYASIPSGDSKYFQVTVNVKADCNIVQIVGNPIQNATYDISTNQAVLLGQPQWTAEFTACKQQMTFVLKDISTNQIADTSIFTLTQSPSVSLFTTSSSKTGLYTLSLIGSIGPSNSQSVNFTVQITNQCPSAILIPGQIPSLQEYSLGGTPLIIDVPAWQDFIGGGLCGTISYAAQDGKTGKSLDNNWITFDPNTLRFRVSSTNLALVGDHPIKLSGKMKMSKKYTSVLFTIKIVDPCADTIIKPSRILDFEYKAKSGPGSFTFLPFKESLTPQTNKL